MSKALSKGQYTAILVAVLCFSILYLGFDIKPKSQKNLEKSRSLNIEATSIQNLVLEAREVLGPDYNVLEALNMELNSIEIDSIKVEKLKSISSKWYELGFPAISGYYAEEVAKILETADSWSVAGTTYLIGAREAEKEKTKTWSFNRAIRSLETAISLDPKNLDNKINLALGFIDNPPSDNPMKGILQLRDLNEKFPDNVKVLSQLGRLSLVTNQVENALKRLKRAEELDPENKTVICLLAEAYNAAGQAGLAQTYNDKCFNN
jgi:tetratricopeptide (TPR) repeat protein